MCLLAIFFRAVPDSALVVGANREEAYARGGEPPQLLDAASRAVGGRDPVAGGTWLAVNEHSLLIAITNRRKTATPPAPRSRGLLVRDLLGCATLESAVGLATRELGSNRYAGCNIACASSAGLVVLHAADWLRVQTLPPGLHVLTAHDVDDASDPRVKHARGWLSAQRLDSAADCVANLQQLCGQADGPGPPICLHGPQGGTVSSSIVVLREPVERSTLLHAQGPPDRTAYADYSELLQAFSSDAQRA